METSTSNPAVASCRDCAFTGASLAIMTGHFAECPSAKNVKCRVCNFRAETAAKVIKHAQTRHMAIPVFEDSGSEADVGAESSESEGASGVDESEVDGSGDPGSTTKEKRKPFSSIGFGMFEAMPDRKCEFLIFVHFGFPPLIQSPIIPSIIILAVIEPYKLQLNERNTVSFYPNATIQTAAL